MKVNKKNGRISIELIAARKANREIEQIVYGAGFHSRTRIKKSKKSIIESENIQI